MSGLLRKSRPRWDRHVWVIGGLLIILGSGAYFFQDKVARLTAALTSTAGEKDKNVEELQKIGAELAQLRGEYENLKNTDQNKRNKQLETDIKAIESAYDKAVATYEDLLDLKSKTAKTGELDKLFSLSLKQLADRNYASASASLASLASQISAEETKLATTFSIPANVVQSNTVPGAGYSRQKVNTDAGEFMVSLIAGGLGSTRVLVDTASDSDCINNCPVLSLATYVSRNGGFGGVNGSYFCPASYPSCAGKTNTFDLLAMNHKKTYFNSGNNVYSSNPAVIFGDGYIRFVGAASSWGRDTSPTGVLSNYPLLVSGGNVAFGGDDDPKKGSKGSRSFVGNRGNTVYIGVVHNATVAESTRVMKALGMENALNLDNGGSTALWSGGYKVGPGRDIPNAIVMVRK